MRGIPEVIDFLNRALTAELTAINQYFGASKLIGNWGYLRLADTYRAESLGEMRDAERLMDRIILLDGHPNMQRMNPVAIGENVLEQLQLDEGMEAAAVQMYRDGVRLCLEHGDAGTRELLEQILVGEEEHLDWIETQLSMIEDIGIERYLQTQIGEEPAG